MSKKQTKRTTPIIKNTEGKYIYGEAITSKILSMLQSNQACSVFEGQQFSISVDFKDGEKVITVESGVVV